MNHAEMSFFDQSGPSIRVDKSDTDMPRQILMTKAVFRAAVLICLNLSKLRSSAQILCLFSIKTKKKNKMGLNWVKLR